MCEKERKMSSSRNPQGGGEATREKGENTFPTAKQCDLSRLEKKDRQGDQTQEGKLTL